MKAKHNKSFNLKKTFRVLIIINIILLNLPLEGQVKVSSKEGIKRVKRGKVKSIELKVYFVDTERGESIYISDGRNNILIDTGPALPTTILRKKYKKKDLKGLMPLLNRLRVKKLDYVILSYVHRDYIGNLPLILEHIKVRNVVDGGYAYKNELYTRVLELIESKKINYILGRRGKSFWVNKDIYVEILYPSMNYVGYTKEYEQSLVFKLKYKSQSFLFTGAIGEETIKKLISEEGENLEGVFLKVPYNHRGDSSGTELLKVLKPTGIYISSRVYLMSLGIIAYSKQAKIRLYTSYNTGNILLRSKGKEYSVLELRRLRREGVREGVRKGIRKVRKGRKKVRKKGVGKG